MLTTCDVLVVGAGPVGLMTGCELARRGVNHIVVETKSHRERYCKALGVAPRTLEIFDQMGILDEALRLGFHLAAMNVVVKGEVVRRIEATHPELAYNAFAMAQPDTEELLEGYWRRFGHSLQRNKTLIALEQESDAVTAEFSDGSRVRCRYLVGCDGAHSSVRKLLGTAFEGERFERTFLLGDVVLNWDRPHREAWQFLLFEGDEMRNNVTVIPNPTGPGRYRVSTSIDAEADCPEQPPLEFLQEIIAPALPQGTVASDLRWSSRYNISHRIAASYRTGRVFLAGDAAHIHPPIGGLGMNTGLQDAHNLGWKLSAVCQGQLDAAILETFHDERHPVGARVVEVTAARMASAMRGGNRSDRPEPPLFDTQLRIRYQPGLLVGGEAPGPNLPRPGERMPSDLALLRPHVARPAHLAELFRDGHFHLFTREVDHRAFGQLLNETLGQQGRSWAILTSEPQEAFGAFVDPDGRWDGTIGTGAVLVRPDGVIGWRGSDLRDLERWLRRLV